MASDGVHDTSDAEKRAQHERSTHHEGSSSPDSDEREPKDVEKSKLQDGENEVVFVPFPEPVVTMKTWAVVVVSLIDQRAAAGSFS